MRTQQGRGFDGAAPEKGVRGANGDDSQRVAGRGRVAGGEIGAEAVIAMHGTETRTTGGIKNRIMGYRIIRRRRADMAVRAPGKPVSPIELVWSRFHRGRV